MQFLKRKLGVTTLIMMIRVKDGLGNPCGPGGPGGPGCQYVIGSYSNRKLEALIRGLSIIPYHVFTS